MRIKIPIIFFILLYPFTCFATGLPPFSARVSVVVSADNNIKPKVESYIDRELRSLGDVVVTDDNPDWILNIVALESKTKGGYESGVVLSVVALKSFDKEAVMSTVSARNKGWVSDAISNLHEFSSHSLRIGAPEELRSICSGIVADFDTKFLQPQRKYWQTVIDDCQKTVRPKKNN